MAIDRERETGCRRRRAGAVAAFVWCLLGHASQSEGIVFADPASFMQKNSWSAGTLGIPTNLGGIRFSSDGSTLYAVGSADVPASAVYAIPVVRDGVTGEIIDLAMAAATPFFTANVSTPAGGLDAAPEEGPAGTLFYTYFNANDGNFIGQRRASDFMEMQFDLEPQGVPLWLGGLAFSPFRTDPGTGFGRLQVGVYNGDPDTTPRDVFEVPLTPVGDGFFTPGPAVRFLSLAEGAVSGLTYVPTGPFAGSLMYASFDAGEVRYLTIDPATGLAIDSQSGMPELGTLDPIDQLFASELSVGPVGLDFDPVTKDLFISTYQGDPLNSIVQVGGFPITVSTTTTTTTTSTLSTPSTTTSTTLPAGCADAATFESIRCRLDALLARVQQLTDVGAVAGKLEKKLMGARARVETGESKLASGSRKGARGALAKAKRLARAFRSLLASKNGRQIPADVRTMLDAEALGVQDDLLELKRSL
jgi:hypothetical protein